LEQEVILVFDLNEDDLVGIAVGISNGRMLLVDRYGLRLWRKYGQNGSWGWRYNETRGYHRMVDRDRNRRRYMTFKRELLGLRGPISITFKNGDNLDLRICNLMVGGISLVQFMH
jgi:hypothetical protein